MLLSLHMAKPLPVGIRSRGEYTGRQQAHIPRANPTRPDDHHSDCLVNDARSKLLRPAVAGNAYKHERKCPFHLQYKLTAFQGTSTVLSEYQAEGVEGTKFKKCLLQTIFQLEFQLGSTNPTIHAKATTHRGDRWQVRLAGADHGIKGMHFQGWQPGDSSVTVKQ